MAWGRRQAVVAISGVAVETETVDSATEARLELMGPADRKPGADLSFEPGMQGFVDIRRQAVARRGRVIQGQDLVANLGVIGRNFPIPAGAVCLPQGPPPAELGDDTAHRVECGVAAAHVVFHFEGSGGFEKSADIAIKLTGVAQRQEQADPRIDGGVAVVRLVDGTGGDVGRLDVAFGIHRLRAEHHSEAVREAPMVDQEKFGVLGGIVDPLAQAVRLAAEVAVVATLDRAVAVVEPHLQLVFPEVVVVTHHRAEVAVVGIDQQAEDLEGGIGPRTIEVDQDPVDDGVEEGLLLVGEPCQQRSPGGQRPRRFCRQAAGFDPFAVIAFERGSARLVGIGENFGASERAGQVLVVVDVGGEESQAGPV